jgi:hypothetical protein
MLTVYEREQAALLQKIHGDVSGIYESQTKLSVFMDQIIEDLEDAAEVYDIV